MADNNWKSQGPGGQDIDLNENPQAMRTLMDIKTIQDAANLAKYLPLQWDRVEKQTFFSRVLYDDNWYRGVVALSVLNTRSRAGRALTQEEMQTVADLSATRMNRTAYEVPVLPVTALYMAFRSRASFRFPFFTPTSDRGFNADVFPAKSMQILSGDRARMAWHAVRLSVYTATSHLFLKVAFLVYASSAFTAEFAANAKLADLRRAIRASEEKRMGEGGRKDVRRQTSPDWRRGGDVGARAEAEASQREQGQQQDRPQRQPQRQDDYSDDYSDDFTDSFSDSQDPADDASPAAPSARRQGWGRPTGGPGAAWERLRHPGNIGEKPTAIAQAPDGHSGWDAVRSGRVPPAAPKPVPPADSRQTGGEYTISSSDEEKAYAQTQAQKDFDAMLEKERQGESDTSRRW